MMQTTKTTTVSGPEASATGQRDDFIWLETDEPHATRRREILQKYPQVAQLFGKEPSTVYYVVAFFSIQMIMCYIAQYYVTSAVVFCLLAYAVGGTCNHSLELGVHEITHDLALSDHESNKRLAMFAALPTGIPFAMSFRRYHHEHHRFQGSDTIDTDIPTVLEGRIFTSPIMKTIFVFLQFFFYGFRPLIVRPLKPSRDELVNYVVQVVFDAFIYFAVGPKALVYLVLSTFLGVGLHPISGHFISEHYVFDGTQETYSYYGPLNAITFNVGFHNEHHDFPRIPWSKLPLLRKMAPEYYDTLKSYNSWVHVLYDFITNPNVGPFSRVKRRNKLA